VTEVGRPNGCIEAVTYDLLEENLSLSHNCPRRAANWASGRASLATRDITAKANELTWSYATRMTTGVKS
jgi:hypothetical protein